MATKQNEADQLVTRWRAELDGYWQSGDTDALKRAEASYGISAASLLVRGSLLAADIMAGLSRYAGELVENPALREVRRPAGVTPPPAEGDWQLGGEW